MRVVWKSSHPELRHARWHLGDGEVVGLDAETLLAGGWHWDAWCSTGAVGARSGVAGDLDMVQRDAEAALFAMLAELTDGTG